MNQRHGEPKRQNTGGTARRIGDADERPLRCRDRPGIPAGRIERNLAQLSDKLNALTDKVNGLSDDVRDLFRVTQLLADNQSHIQVAFEGLIGQIDRSIRSQQGNSHPTP